MGHARNRLHSGKRTYRRTHLAQNFITRYIHPQSKGAFCTEAGIDAEDIGEGANKKARPNEKHKGQGHLSGDKNRS